jgi:UDP-glucose 4-epimerase
MLKSINMGEFYRVPADNRDLNYSQYFSEGNEMKDVSDYNSNNTKQLNVEEVKKLLLNLDYVDNILNINEF